MPNEPRAEPPKCPKCGYTKEDAKEICQTQTAALMAENEALRQRTEAISNLHLASLLDVISAKKEIGTLRQLLEASRKRVKFFEEIYKP